MTTVATAGQASGVIVRRFDETAGWTEEHRIEGGWPTASPGNGGWTTSVVDLETRLEHTAREGALEVPGADTRPAALIGPRLAHYAAWADSGDVLCYVARRPGTLAPDVAARRNRFPHPPQRIPAVSSVGAGHQPAAVSPRREPDGLRRGERRPADAIGHRDGIPDSRGP
ncbi:MAG: hypothetical protein IPI85_16760 [Dehalococcoidia bacterium]|nr:hypothetical protein [Dehalococcoidia bacterium]